MNAASAYIHVPFCKHRCGYCNFTLVANRDDLVPHYLDALELEISQHLSGPQAVKTVFLGGGTPSHLNTAELRRLLELINCWLPLEEGGEFSCELNPIDCTPEKLGLLTDHGVNRLSIGGQSFSNRKLKALERDHTGEVLQQAIECGGEFCPNVSLDLIFAAPQESLSEWQADLQIATSLPITHVSTYGLTIEKGAAFYGKVKRGSLREVDEGLQLDMYMAAINHLNNTDGWKHYEVSSFAKQNARCLHNQTYWLGQPWYGFGPGAASLRATSNPTYPLIRSVNHRSTNSYIKRIQNRQPATAEEDLLSREQAIREQVVFGLRMLDGISPRKISEQWAEEDIERLFEPYLSRFVEEGWLQRAGEQLRLTQNGLMISDSLWPDLLSP